MRVYCTTRSIDPQLPPKNLLQRSVSLKETAQIARQILFPSWLRIRGACHAPRDSSRVIGESENGTSATWSRFVVHHRFNHHRNVTETRRIMNIIVHEGGGILRAARSLEPIPASSLRLKIRSRREVVEYLEKASISFFPFFLTSLARSSNAVSASRILSRFDLIRWLSTRIVFFGLEYFFQGQISSKRLEAFWFFCSTSFLLFFFFFLQVQARLVSVETLLALSFIKRPDCSFHSSFECNSSCPPLPLSSVSPGSKDLSSYLYFPIDHPPWLDLEFSMRGKFSGGNSSVFSSRTFYIRSFVYQIRDILIFIFYNKRSFIIVVIEFFSLYLISNLWSIFSLDNIYNGNKTISITYHRLLIVHHVYSKSRYFFLHASSPLSLVIYH